jgi:hypothetical protein
MNQLNLEVTFIHGSKLGQVWLLQNLTSKDILDFYENCSFAFIKDTCIIVVSDEKKEDLYEFVNRIIIQAVYADEEIQSHNKH